MKKLLFVALASALVMNASAQSESKPWAEGKDWSLEVLFNPFSNNFETFRMAGLKGRYFMDSQRAVRVNLGLGYNTYSNEQTEDSDDPDQTLDNYLFSHAKVTDENSNLQFNLSVGYEYHFDATGRLDLFAGAELGYQGNFFSGQRITKAESKSRSTTLEEYYSYNNRTGRYESYSYTKTTDYKSNSTETYSYKNCNSNGNTNSNAIVAKLFVGADYYLTNTIYVGAELGISANYGMGKNGYHTLDKDRISHSETELSGTYPYTLSQHTYYNTKESSYYNSDSGITKRLYTVVSSTASENQVDDSTFYNGTSGHSTNNFRLGFYIEPALRLGVRF